MAPLLYDCEDKVDDFKPIGDVAKNILNKITIKRVNQLSSRHIAMALSDLEHLSPSEKEVIKRYFRLFGKSVLEQLFDIKDSENDNSK